MIRALAAGLAAGLLLAAPALAEPIAQSADEHRNGIGEIDRRGDHFVHRSSGYVFPAALGDLPLRKTYSFGPGDGSVFYTLRGGGYGDPSVSLYVYQAGMSLAEEVEEVEKSLRDAMPGTVIQRPAQFGAPPAGVAEQWYDAMVDDEPVITGYRLFRDGDWSIKVRLTLPKAAGETGLRRSGEALADIVWFIPGATAERRSARLDSVKAGIAR